MQSYANDPPPAAFRVIDTPMVVWIWIGGAIVIGGALIALWPGTARAGGSRASTPPGSGASSSARSARGIAWSTWSALLVLGVVVAVVVLRPLLSGRRTRREVDERRCGRSRRPRRPSTARSATPSWTTAPGKLSEEDWRAVDRELRGQAIEILKRLDDLTG